MARGVNKVILVGNLGNDPEVKYMPSGNAVANVSLATAETWKDKDTGERREKTEWHRLTFFGKLAEIAGEYLHKGSQVYVEGKLQTREWEKDGVKRYTTEVIVSDLQMLGDKPSTNSGQSSNSRPNSVSDRHEQGAIDAMQKDAGGDPFDDEIPF